MVPHRQKTRHQERKRREGDFNVQTQQAYQKHKDQQDPYSCQPKKRQPPAWSLLKQCNDQ